jgi:hypothetical protein
LWTRASSRAATFVLLTALVVAARAPFIAVGDRFFDSDEAVEGLMARHVLAGEFPVMMWGQHYKGVPEIYLTAAVFAAFGASVAALKSATLVWFAAFVCVQFILLETVFPRRVAWIASLLTVAAPPVLVQWSLSANAEIAISLLAGALLLLGWHRWRSSESSRGLALAGFALGFGLWVQQFIIYYVVAVAVFELHQRRPAWGDVKKFFGASGSPAPVRWTIRVLTVFAGFYLILGFAAFFGGFAGSIAGLTVSVTHAQKMWRLGGGLLLVAALLRWVWSGGLRDVSTRRAWTMAAVAFLAGYAPALVHRLLSGRSGPVAGMNADAFLASLEPIAEVVVPTLFGYRSGTTAPIDVPPWTALLIMLAMAAAFAVRRREELSVFHVFLLTTPAVFLASGAFVDTQSYRYLMPIFGALPAVLAVGVDRLWRVQRMGATWLAFALVLLFTWQQVAWHRMLQPDVPTAQLLRCIAEHQVRFAKADYWLAYKVTFLTREETIVAVDRRDQMIRYAPYQEAVAARAPVPTLTLATTGAGQPVCSDFVKM